MIREQRENPQTGWPERRTIEYPPWEPFPEDEAKAYFRCREHERQEARRERRKRVACMTLSAAFMTAATAFTIGRSF